MNKFIISYLLGICIFLFIIFYLWRNIFELSPYFAVGVGLFLFTLWVFQTYIFIRFRKGIQRMGETYTLPTFSGEIKVQKDEIMAVQLYKGFWERLMDFTRIKLEMRAGHRIEFIMPDDLLEELRKFEFQGSRDI